MAEFNNEIITEIENDKSETVTCGMYLMSCLPKNELEKLDKKWRDNIIENLINGSYAQFAFENIEVKLKENF